MSRTINNGTFRGDYTIIYGNNNDIIGDYNNIYGNNNNIKGDHNMIKGNNNDVNGDYNNVIGNNNDVNGDYNNTIGNNNSSNKSSKPLGNNYNVIHSGNNNSSNKSSKPLGNNYNVIHSDNATIHINNQSIKNRHNIVNGYLYSNGAIVDKSVNDKSETEKRKYLDIKCDEVEDNPDNACIICLNNKKKCAAIPCGHFMFCISCAIDLEKDKLPCPTCRKNVDFFNIMYI